MEKFNLTLKITETNKTLHSRRNVGMLDITEFGIVCFPPPVESSEDFNVDIRNSKYLPYYGLLRCDVFSYGVGETNVSANLMLPSSSSSLL
jgi:hypothetical protein